MERIRHQFQLRLRAVRYFFKPKRIVAGPTAILIGVIVTVVGAAIGVVTTEDPVSNITLRSVTAVVPLTAIMVIFTYGFLVGLRYLQFRLPGISGWIFYGSNIFVGAMGLVLRQQYLVEGKTPAAWGLLSNQLTFVFYLIGMALFTQLTIANAGEKLKFQYERANTALDQLQRQQLLLLEGQEQVRKDLARYLHDGLQSTLVVLGLQMQRILKDVPNEAQKVLNASISELEQLRSIDVRSAIEELSPDLENQTVIVSLARLANKYQGAMEIEFDFDPACSRADLEPNLKLALYRIIEQGLLNAARHGKAKKVEISASISEGNLALVLVNDGPEVQKDYVPGVGLSIIDGWCKFFGGSWNLQSSHGLTALAVHLKTQN